MEMTQAYAQLRAVEKAIEALMTFMKYRDYFGDTPLSAVCQPKAEEALEALGETNAVNRDHGAVGQVHVLVETVEILLAVVDDFSRNLSRCVLQDYARLNEGTRQARRLLARLEEA